MPSPSQEALFRLSLRHLFVLVALVAVAIASLKHASDVWLALIGTFTMLSFFAAIIVAVVDRGPRQAFAIGFAIVVAVYGLLVINGEKYSRADRRNNEFDFMSGRLPTTRLLRYVHVAVDDSRWIDQATGQEIPEDDPAVLARQGGTRAQAMAFGRVYRREVPPREIFMPIGHCWWALLLGYAGGYFARFVYLRRVREQSPLAAESA